MKAGFGISFWPERKIVSRAETGFFPVLVCGVFRWFFLFSTFFFALVEVEVELDVMEIGAAGYSCDAESCPLGK